MANKMPAWFNRECGGRVAKADGGWTGEGDSGKKLREDSIKKSREADAHMIKSVVPLGIGTGALAGLAGSISKAGRVGKLVSGGLMAAGVKPTIDMIKAEDEATDLRLKADKAEGRASGGSAKGKWIQGAIKHPGSLRKALGAKEGEPIPAKKLAKAAHSDNPTMRKRANLAKTLKGLGK